MVNFKQIGEFFFTKKVMHTLIAYGLLICLIYFVQDFLLIFFLTFVFGYLFLSGGEFIKEKIDALLQSKCRNKKTANRACKAIPLNLIVIIEYLIFIFFIVFTVSSIAPKLVSELADLPNAIPALADQVQEVSYRLEEISTLNSEINLSLKEIISQRDIDVIINVFGKLKSFGAVFLQIFLSLVLSFIFIIDRFSLKKYLLGIKKSNFSFLYKEYRIIFDKIIKSFGLIFKAQATIAFLNAMLTTIGLIIIGLIHGGSFPYILTLALVVFILGFVPILGFLLSSIPIIFVAYSIIGGYVPVIEVLVLISIVHVAEAYYFNPRIVSRFIEVPMSLTFIILIISEHFFGMAGLLIGISMFYFIVGLLRDINKNITKKNKDAG